MAAVKGKKNATPVDPLLTLDEVAEMLSVTRRWVRRARAEGRIKAVKCGHLIRFKKSDVLDYIEEQRG